eukprot:TRINITY_DN6937_c0_g1_i1.p1 TRINITY_DN6937_c0_g1~~TRINITY_DN6937_c0_g1_i1.p1  ORF type:complete len:391 (+),score=100.10 TRINITY_DN6937_c0_g1_i1:167-1174(+)
MILLKSNQTLTEQGVLDDSQLFPRITAKDPDSLSKAELQASIVVYWKLKVVDGHLLKRGEKGIKGWKKRFFTLRGSNLFYYKNREAKEANQAPLGCISMMMVTSINQTDEHGVVTSSSSSASAAPSPAPAAAPASSGSFRGVRGSDSPAGASQTISTSGVHGCAFVIETQRRRYLLLAKNQEIREAWLTQLAVARKAFTSETGSKVFSDHEDEDGGDDNTTPEEFIERSEKFSIKGWLMKKGEKGPAKTYKKRFFELRGYNLYYSKNEGEASVGFINLLDVYEITPNESIHEGKKVDCGFVAVTPYRTYFLIAQHPEDRNRWVSGLNAVLRSVNQ